MRRVLLAASVLALGPGRALPAGPEPGAGLSPGEREACAEEIRVIANRDKVFAERGLSPAERRRRNAQAYEVLEACAREHRDRERRRAGAKPAEPADDLARKRKALEARAEQRRLDAERARNPRYMRPALSGVLCYQAARKSRAEAGLEEERRFTALGYPDRMRGYALRSELSRAEQGLALARRALAELGGPLGCEEGVVPVLAHCISVRDGETAGGEGCESEEVQQYLRLVR